MFEPSIQYHSADTFNDPDVKSIFVSLLTTCKKLEFIHINATDAKQMSKICEYIEIRLLKSQQIKLKHKRL